MGWIDEQIKERKLSDQEVLEDAFMDVASVVLGKRLAGDLNDSSFSKSAINEILKYYHYKPVDIKEKVEYFEDALQYALRPYGIMYRHIKLDEDWYKQAYGPILSFTKDDNIPIALIPKPFGGYSYIDQKTREKINVNKKNAASINDEAICFYRPLPLTELGIKDLLAYLKGCLSIDDVVMVGIGTVLISLFGLIMPRVMKILTGPILSSKNLTLLLSMAVFIVCVTLSTNLLNAFYSIVSFRLSSKTSHAVDAAVMSRLLSLPPSFFRKYSSGELYNRANSVNALCSMLLSFVFSIGLTSLSSLLYINQIFNFAPVLVVPALIIIALTITVTVFTTLVQTKISKSYMEIAAKGSGLNYAYLNGIQKIKLTGAEKRVFSRWLAQFAKESEFMYNPPKILKLSTEVLLAISLLGNIILYYLAVKHNVGQANYFAFNTTYGLVMGAFSSLANIGLSFAKVKPILEMAEPILKEKPEAADDKEIINKVRGKISLNNITFRYDDNSPNVIENLSLDIKPKEYVAIVGKTGCGKSTLMRLLLGFEKPQRGAIYYDDKDIEKLDLKSLRRKIGVVTQSSGLFQGDIYSNIAIASDNLTLEGAWEAAEIAGIAEDIRNMPMGMHTLISEGQGGVSGGQKQRIMIARAVASKPSILMFDEATSALDNITQKHIADALDKLDCTRIVIAHRLSTIKNCDRILVLDKGKIIEEGTYDELIKNGGFFKELIDRQRIDNE